MNGEARFPVDSDPWTQQCIYMPTKRSTLAMADLVARGPNPQDFWRESLAPGSMTLGRRPEKSTWSAPWDQQISGLHATLTWRDRKLHVRRHPKSMNPIFHGGQDQGFEEFAVGVGGVFVIGETTFAVEETPPPPRVTTPSRTPS